ncbi:MAG TPA: hypothetical protein VF070_38705 [Streptosporangiaceae bacterium]
MAQTRPIRRQGLPRPVLRTGSRARSCRNAWRPSSGYHRPGQGLAVESHSGQSTDPGHTRRADTGHTHRANTGQAPVNPGQTRANPGRAYRSGWGRTQKRRACGERGAGGSDLRPDPFEAAGTRLHLIRGGVQLSAHVIREVAWWAVSHD